MTNETTPTKKIQSKLVERVTIAEDLQEKLKTLTHQANETLNGITIISKSDVINFILQSHSDTFSENELKSLKVIHFDEIKFSHWITTQLKEAQASGKSITIKELIEQHMSRDISLPKRSKRARIKRQIPATRTNEDPQPIPGEGEGEEKEKE